MTTMIGLNADGMKLSAIALNRYRKSFYEHDAPSPKDYDSFLHACLAAIRTCEDATAPASKIGVSLSGIVDPQTQNISASIHLPFLTGRPFREDLAAALGKEVTLVNDANALTWLEANEGAARRGDSVLGLVLGTGVGAGYAYEGQLMTGRKGRIAEVGLMPMFPFAEQADLLRLKGGAYLTIGDVLSEAGFSRLHEIMRGEPCRTDVMSERCARGDKTAKPVLERYYALVAHAMGGFICTLDPDVIVASGSITKLPYFHRRVSANLKTFADGSFDTPIVRPRFGDKAEAKGAALFAQQIS